MSATFTVAITKQTVMGDMKVIFGTFAAAGGSTGGDIATGLTALYHIDITPFGSAVVVGSAGSINETKPTAAVPTTPTVTLVCTADTTGTWVAYGK
jgi:tetrahydromethanopterin S-methyltransferase subunit E